MSESAPRLSPRAARHQARVFALQALYSWLMKDGQSKELLGEIDAHMQSEEGYALIDHSHFNSLFYGAVEQQAQLRAHLQPLLDRPISELSYVEHAILLLSAYELAEHIEVPYRVVINEAIELAKVFGGNEGYKYVNGVLDKLSAQLRAVEVAAKRQSQSS